MNKKRSKKQNWREGDLFAIPLINGESLLGQILSIEPSVLNSVSCALFDERFEAKSAPTPEPGKIFSILFATRDCLDSGEWPIVGSARVAVSRERFPYESLRSSGFIGAEVEGSGIIEKFANAFCALEPWDEWFDPRYLDGLLISPDKKPKMLIYKKKQ